MVEIMHPAIRLGLAEIGKGVRYAHVGDVTAWLYAEADAYSQAGKPNTADDIRYLARRFNVVARDLPQP